MDVGSEVEQVPLAAVKGGDGGGKEAEENERGGCQRLSTLSGACALIIYWQCIQAEVWFAADR
jgi:hypothetical protein